ncbi:hypothetical protein DEF23_19895 [Marinitenerispora sediminis]|nr:hypothetical protein DEF23_19895 [Marinitenerispora sediminis]
MPAWQAGAVGNRRERGATHPEALADPDGVSMVAGVARAPVMPRARWGTAERAVVSPGSST